MSLTTRFRHVLPMVSDGLRFQKFWWWRELVLGLVIILNPPHALDFFERLLAGPTGGNASVWLKLVPGLDPFGLNKP